MSNLPPPPNLPQPGDEVSWEWGAGHPSGTVAETSTTDPITIETKRGNTVSKNADESNPAVRIEQDGGNEVVKRAAEVTVEEQAGGEGHKRGQGEQSEKGQKDEGKQTAGEKQASGKKASGKQTGGKQESGEKEGVEEEDAEGEDDGEYLEDPEGTEDEEAEAEDYETGASEEVEGAGEKEKASDKVEKKGKSGGKDNNGEAGDVNGKTKSNDAKDMPPPPSKKVEEVSPDAAAPAEAQVETPAGGRKRKAASVSENKIKEIIEEENPGKRTKHSSIG
ncbi:hypothetical protein OQA88_11053 [Cercophora sp. LCS_1]